MVVWEDKVFKILKGKRGYVLIRKEQPYKYHAHFNTLEGCQTLITLFYKKKFPYNDYYAVAMTRITSTNELHYFTEQHLKQKCVKR